MSNSKNYVQVVGMAWAGFESAYEYPLSSQDIDQIEVIADIRSLSAKPDDLVQDEILREDVAEWIRANPRDFASIHDFTAMIHGDEIPWNDIDNASVYHDTVYGYMTDDDEGDED